jgi:Predicted phosphohydrolases
MYLVTFFFVLVFQHALVAKEMLFNSSREFTILQITDLHFCEDTEKDIQTQNLQKSLIEKVNPNLVIITGDGISGQFISTKKNLDAFKPCWEEMTKIMTDSNTNSAYILGKSDLASGINSAQIIDLEKNYPLSMLGQYSEKTGETNYVIPVYSSYDIDKVATLLWMFDTSKHGIDQEQISWAFMQREYFNQMNGANIDFQLAFFHAPTQDFLSLYNNGYFTGERPESINCSSSDFFNFARENNFQGMYVGANHENDFSGTIDGIELAYGRRTGYGGYSISNGFKKGARVIKLTEVLRDDKVTIEKESYIIDEDLRKINPILSKREGDEQKECLPLSDYPLVGGMTRLTSILLVFSLLIGFFGAGYILWKNGYLSDMFHIKAHIVELEALKSDLNESLDANKDEKK